MKVGKSQFPIIAFDFHIKRSENTHSFPNPFQVKVAGYRESETTLFVVKLVLKPLGSAWLLRCSNKVAWKASCQSVSLSSEKEFTFA